MEKFHHDLHGLKVKILQMGELALEMLTNSITSLKDLDEELANHVHDQRKLLAQFDFETEEEAMRLIALYQPMAIDLRTLGTVLKLNTYLTRIGRYGKDIANVTRIDMKSHSHVKKLISIPQMMTIIHGMVSDALKAFRENKIEYLVKMAERDNEVDELRITIYRECLTYMFEDPKNIPVCTAYIMVARYLERCGDHACKMAEKIHYMVTGQHIEIK
jgi:phosphate transport system protein